MTRRVMKKGDRDWPRPEPKSQDWSERVPSQLQDLARLNATNAKSSAALHGLTSARSPELQAKMKYGRR